MSVVFAASYPERVSALVLYGGKARELWAPDYLIGSTEREERQNIEEGLETFVTTGGTEEMVRSGMPSADEDEVRGWARTLRYGASPASLEALDRMNRAIDVREVLPVLSTPTLVVHQRADPWVPIEHGRYLAEHIAGAVFAEMDGDGHLPTAESAPRLVAHVMPFLLDVVSQDAAPEPDRVLATVLFSDIVGSTARAAELGDSRWRGAAEPAPHGGPSAADPVPGVELDTAGDGFFARFDGPARAIRCAQAIRDAVEEIGLSVRLGPAHRGVRAPRWQGGRDRGRDRRTGVGARGARRSTGVADREGPGRRIGNRLRRPRVGGPQGRTRRVASLGRHVVLTVPHRPRLGADLCRAPATSSGCVEVTAIPAE